MAKAGKLWFQSKTLWLGIISIIAGIVEVINGQVSTGASISFLGVANIVLRAITSDSIRWK